MEQCFAAIGIDPEHENGWSRIDPMEHITPAMPGTFIWHGSMDDLVKATGSMHYAQRLIDNGIRTELHIYDNCGHGISLGTRETAAVAEEINDYGAVWLAQLLRWMEELGHEKK